MAGDDVDALELGRTGARFRDRDPHAATPSPRWRHDHLAWLHARRRLLYTEEAGTGSAGERGRRLHESGSSLRRPPRQRGVLPFFPAGSRCDGGDGEVQLLPPGSRRPPPLADPLPVLRPPSPRGWRGGGLGASPAGAGSQFAREEKKSERPGSVAARSATAQTSAGAARAPPPRRPVHGLEQGGRRREGGGRRTPTAPERSPRRPVRGRRRTGSAAPPRRPL